MINKLTKKQELHALKVGYAATLDVRRLAEEAIDAGEVPKKHIKKLRQGIDTASMTLAAMILERE